MEQVTGVEVSYANQRGSADESGDLIRLTLRPGADPEKVVRGVQRILNEEFGDRVAAPLTGAKAAEALQGQEWQDKTRGVEFAQSQSRAEARRRSALLLALLLVGCAAVGLGLLWRRRRRRTEGE
jgi:hypothetical protein